MQLNFFPSLDRDRVANGEVEREPAEHAMGECCRENTNVDVLVELCDACCEQHVIRVEGRLEET